jgi:hypothetical protein
MTRLSNNPGITPFYLGIAKIQKNEHTFLHYYELDKIRDSIDSFNNNLLAFSNYLRTTDPKYFRNFLVSNEVLGDKFTLIVKKYNSLSASSLRYKRGLINGLGSVIKSITGNLDHDDAVAYTRAISILQKNQERLRSSFTQGISLNTHLIHAYNSTMSTIVNNQYKIYTQINEVAREINMTNYRLSDFIKMTSLYNLLQINCLNIYDLLTSLENAIALSRLHITHHSVISADNVQYISETLTTLYESDELLINSHTDLRDIYDLIELGSYYVDNTVVFVLKLPIMNKNKYSYYHLYPTPTYNSTVIIPPKPFLAMDGSHYVYTEQECKKFKDLYYCEESSFLTTNSYNDCIHQLILKHDIIKECRYTAVKMVPEIWQKMDDQHYLLSCTKPTKIRLTCDEESHDSVQGTYLFEVPERCSVTTQQNTIRNLQNKLQGHPIKLLSFDLENISISNGLKPLKLDKIQLDRLYELESLIEKEELPVLEDVDVEDASKAFNYWLIPVYSIMIASCFYMLYKKWKTCHTEQRTTTVAAAGPVETPGAASAASSSLPFFTKP